MHHISSRQYSRSSSCFNPRKGREMHHLIQEILLPGKHQFQSPQGARDASKSYRFLCSLTHVSIPARGARCIVVARLAFILACHWFQSPQGARDASLNLHNSSPHYLCKLYNNLNYSIQEIQYTSIFAQIMEIIRP